MEGQEKKNTENIKTKKEKFYKKLKESLDNTTIFPADYLFKFIVPTNHTKLYVEKNLLNKDKDSIDKNDAKAIDEINNKIDIVNAKIKLEDDKLNKVDSIFKDKNASIQTKKSKSGKYTSKTIKVKMESSDDVIKSYKEAEGIDGIISL
jgi:putative lipoic acid-binding regulatory protein